MGLDIGKARWSYSGFNRFRERLAGLAGVNLSDMQGFGGSVGRGVLKNDPIRFLLNHSDCEGSISYKSCAVIAPRLIDLLKQFDPSDPDDCFDIQEGTTLVESMLECAKNRKRLEFK